MINKCHTCGKRIWWPFQKSCKTKSFSTKGIGLLHPNEVEGFMDRFGCTKYHTHFNRKCTNGYDELRSEIED